MTVFETSTGWVRGVVENGVSVFRGIPYGVAGRFEKPLSVTPWMGVRDASKFGPWAPQDPPPPPGPYWAVPTEGVDFRISEDCLLLNIWTRDLDPAARRPIMVWLHGGGFGGGAGDYFRADGISLARDQDVVVVTINHRLNAFGFLSLAAFDEDYDDSGNLGMLDIVLMLEWIRENAAAFGGDPGNVTVFGESGGGLKVCTLLAMPSASGLFHRAIVQSGPLIRAVSRDVAAQRADRFIRGLGVEKGDIVAALREIPADELAGAALRFERKEAARSGIDWKEPRWLLGFVPVVGGSLPRHPFDPDAPPISRHIPLMVGTTRHDGSVAPGSLPEGLTAILEDLILHGIPIDRATDLIESYLADSPEASVEDLAQEFATDSRLRVPTIRIAERAAATGMAVYAYEFCWQHPTSGRAEHGIEVPFVFNSLREDLLPAAALDGARSLARTTSAVWAAFARTGSPAHAALPSWPSYTVPERATMRLDLDSGVEHDPRPVSRAALRHD